MKPTVHEDILESIDFILHVLRENQWVYGRPNRWEDDNAYGCLSDDPCIIEYDHFHKISEMERKHNIDCKLYESIKVLEIFSQVEHDLRDANETNTSLTEKDFAALIEDENA